ncbi:MAG: MBL fold metallo-hydrolase [Promethearchaeota archaeon]
MEHIKVEILGSESMGVRSACTVVTTPDIRIMLDPGCALGPRVNNEIPHPLEYKALHEITRKIIKESEKCDLISISHYHHDHFKPRLIDELYIHSTPDIFKKIFINKDLFTKSTRHHVGKNQKSRGINLKQSASKLVGKIRDSDSMRYYFGDTIIDFSWPVYHGEMNTRLGFVIMTRIRYKKECFIHASDIQGPVIEDTMKFLLDVPADVVFLGGPPLYLKDKIHSFPFEEASKNAARLHEKIPILIMDHHVCRDKEKHDKFIKGIINEARAVGVEAHQLLDAATFMGKEPRYLESCREELYKDFPPSDKFLEWMSLSKELKYKKSPPI